MAQAVMYAEKQTEEVAPQETEEVAASLAEMSVNEDVHKKNRIQVSNTKKPLFFYLNLAKRYIKQHDVVELSALGMAIPTLVTIVEILKSSGIALEKKVVTSTVDSKDESKGGRLVQKAKLEIVLVRNEKAGDQKASAETATLDSQTNSKSGAADDTTTAVQESDSKAADGEKKEG